MNIDSYDHILFSFHGLPNSQVNKVYSDNICEDKNCDKEITELNKFCYKATSYETARLIANSSQINSDQYTVCFQSRLTKNWLEPFTDEVLKSLAENGKKRILIVSPAFTADCLETVIELGDEYNSLFQAAGGEVVEYVPSLNASKPWVDSIKEILG
jgi:ferrochelatase